MWPVGSQATQYPTGHTMHFHHAGTWTGCYAGTAVVVMHLTSLVSGHTIAVCVAVHPTGTLILAVSLCIGGCVPQ